MKYLPMLDLMKQANKEGYAIPAFEAWNAEVISLILRTAHEMRSPVIIMGVWVDLDEIPPEEYGPIARTVAERYDVPAALHLDHGDSMERVSRCIDNGFTSVMLDYSARPYTENAAALKEVAALARAKGVTVEGELGCVGQVDDVTSEGSAKSTLTDPDEAKKYIDETGIDVLAVGIGNAHGNYTSLPNLDFNRLERIHETTAAPLVLHGGSGTPVEDLKRASALGIAKVNVASELMKTYRESLLSQWGEKRNMWVPTAAGEATRALSAVIRKWMTNLGSAGKA